MFTEYFNHNLVSFFFYQWLIYILQFYRKKYFCNVQSNKYWIWNIIILVAEFYVYGSVHRWPILIVVQRDATQSSLFIILQVHCTCFRCQPHPSSGIHKTVTTASGTGHIFCAAPSLQRGQASLGGRELHGTGGCSYSLVYSWWGVWLTPEICRVNLQNNKWTALCCILLDNY